MRNDDCGREKDGKWKHDGRHEGDTGDDGPVRQAQHRARVHGPDLRGASTPRQK
jgi:hypothetical protein